MMMQKKMRESTQRSNQEQQVKQQQAKDQSKDFNFDFSDQNQLSHNFNNPSRDFSVGDRNDLDFTGQHSINTADFKLN